MVKCHVYELAVKAIFYFAVMSLCILLAAPIIAGENGSTRKSLISARSDEARHIQLSQESVPFNHQKIFVKSEGQIFYTIRTGNFADFIAARKQFYSIIRGLNGKKIDFLRIEKVGEFYSVRLGKFEDYTSAREVIRTVKPGIPAAIIIKAYVKADRIIRLYAKKLPAEGNGKIIEPLPFSESDALNKSREIIKEGKYAEALSILSPFISEPMKYSNVVSDYIVILVWEGRLDDAINMYEKLPDSFPRYDYLLRNMGKAYYDKKEFSKALLMYQSALEQSPSDKEARKGMVFSLVHTSDYNRASDYLETYLMDDPDSMSLAVAKAYLLLLQDRYKEAFEVFHLLVQRSDIDREHLFMSRDDLIASLPPVKRQAMAAYLHNAPVEFTDDYILVLVLNKDYKTALKAFEASQSDIDQDSLHLFSWVAWAYFKTGRTERAKHYYKKLLGIRPDYVRANIGLAYCLAKEGDSNTAIDILDGLLKNEPKNQEIMFARAFAFEKSTRFWSAIREYDRILKINQQNTVAKRLRLVALSDLGVSSYALEEAKKDFPHDSEFLDSIMGDMVTDRINWKEYPGAISMIQPQLEDDENLKARYIYIAALVENGDMEQAVEAYEGLVKDGVSPPAWVLENAANAYLYLKQPYNALELYDKALELQPTFKSRIGKFYVLQEIREWERANKVLNDLDREPESS
jgi:tetratricopeptide (TPR) repeat protein